MYNIVLVEPKGEENVGSILRAMSNFNFTDISIVNPRCDYKSDIVKMYSLKAFSLFDNIRIYKSLSDSLKERDISIAITRRIGNWRKNDFEIKNLKTFLNEYQNKTISLVFGREENGLTNEEISFCDLICSIETSEMFPSLNLSHAVAIVLYELKIQKKSYSKTFPTKIEFDNMLNKIFSSLEGMSFFKNQSPWIIKRFIRNVLVRAKIDKEETQIIKNVFTSIEGILKKTRGIF